LATASSSRACRILKAANRPLRISEVRLAVE